MTTIELEARKALLVKEILTDINSEEMIEKLSHYLKRIQRAAHGKGESCSLSICRR